MNLIEGLQVENRKHRKFLLELEETAKLLGHKSASDDPGFAASMMITQALAL